MAYDGYDARLPTQALQVGMTLTTAVPFLAPRGTGTGSTGGSQALATVHTP